MSENGRGPMVIICNSDSAGVMPTFITRQNAARAFRGVEVGERQHHKYSAAQARGRRCLCAM